MRIAITGTHGSGKTTLIADFVAANTGYERIAEPYWLLVQQGTVFADGPTIADLEDQLAQSCTLILASTQDDVIFDRCPLDFIAYLEVVGRKEGVDWAPDGRLLTRIEKALAALDLIGFVPLRQPDEIAAGIEYPKLRASVDKRLKSMLRNDDLGLLQDGPRIVEIEGNRQQRVLQLAAEAGRATGQG